MDLVEHMLEVTKGRVRRSYSSEGVYGLIISKTQWTDAFL